MNVIISTHKRIRFEEVKTGPKIHIARNHAQWVTMFNLTRASATRDTQGPTFLKYALQ